MSAAFVKAKSQEPIASNVDLVSLLPPKICENPHLLIEPEQISQSALRINPKRHRHGVRTYRSASVTPVDAPEYPILLQCLPQPVYIQLDLSPVRKRVRIMNIGTRLTWFHIYGLKGDIAQLGAHWRYYPRTNFVLAPGIAADIFVEARPKHAPLPHAIAELQLAAGLKRDLGVCLITIDVNVEFLQYSRRFLASPADSPMSMKSVV